MAVSKFTDTSYDLSIEDLAFANELAKVGFIHLLSGQVSFRDENFGKPNSSHSLNFKVYGEEKSNGLVYPSNGAIEHISSNESGLSILFKVSK